MISKLYLYVTGSIFGLVAIVHLIRLILHWPAQIGTWVIPIWLSWVFLFVAGLLSVWAFRMASGR